MIKNIIFDVGDVLFDYRWKEALMEHGLNESEAEKLANLILNDHLWYLKDMAIMTDEEVLAEYHKKYPQYANEIDWFMGNIGSFQIPRHEVWEKMHVLKNMGYKIYILSNYPEKLFKQHTKGASFLNDVDGMVISYQIHIGKPNKEIYMYLLKKYDLKAEECLFLDDREANTESAVKLGMKAETVKTREYLNKILDSLINKTY